jgi:hypothetical protein
MSARVLSGPWRGQRIRERHDPHHLADVVAARRGIYRPERRTARSERRCINAIAYLSWIVAAVLLGWFAARAF